MNPACLISWYFSGEIFSPEIIHFGRRKAYETDISSGGGGGGGGNKLVENIVDYTYRPTYDCSEADDTLMRERKSSIVQKATFAAKETSDGDDDEKGIRVYT